MTKEKLERASDLYRDIRRGEQVPDKIISEIQHSLELWKAEIPQKLLEDFFDGLRKHYAEKLVSVKQEFEAL